MSQNEHTETPDQETSNIIQFPKLKPKNNLATDLQLECPETLEGYLNLLRNHLDIIDYIQVLEALVSKRSYLDAEPAVKQLADYALMVSFVELSVQSGIELQ